MEYTVDNGHTDITAHVLFGARMPANHRLMHPSEPNREVTIDLRNRATERAH